jgi:biopolymer transport protein ExbD
MRKQRKHADDAAEVNMTPMLDIVFILLIFFIVTATFLTESGLDLRTPPGCEDCPPPIDPPPVILVQVDGENNIFVNRDRTALERVSSAVERFLAENAGSPVVIEVEDEADHGVVVYIWDEMKSGGIPVNIQRRAGGEG